MPGTRLYAPLHPRHHRHPGCALQEGELTLKLLNLFFDSVTKFQNMDTVLQPVFYELIAKTVQQLHVSRDKEGFLDVLLNLFRTIQVSILASV